MQNFDPLACVTHSLVDYVTLHVTLHVDGAISRVSVLLILLEFASDRHDVRVWKCDLQNLTTSMYLHAVYQMLRDLLCHEMTRVMLLCNEPSALEECSITRKAETPIELLSIEQSVYQQVWAFNPQNRKRSSDSESSSRVMAFLP